MATTALWRVKGNLDRVVSYVQDEQKTSTKTIENILEYVTKTEKTEQQLFVSGINCLPETATRNMLKTKQRWGKTDGVMAYHGYQSFVPGEVTPELAHWIGLQLAQELWGNDYEVIVATHLDREHIHNHFVINSVSFRGQKFHMENGYHERVMRPASDRFCKEYGLHATKAKDNSKRSELVALVDKAIEASKTVEGFFSFLKEHGCEVKADRKYWAVKPPHGERFIRLRSLGSNYTNQAIINHISGQHKARYNDQERRSQSHAFGASKKDEKKPQSQDEHEDPYTTKRARSYTFYHTTFRPYPMQRWYIYRLLYRGRQYYRMTDAQRSADHSLQKYSASVGWLWSHNIGSTSELKKFMAVTEMQIGQLAAQRKPLYRLLQKSQDEQLKKQIDELTYKIQDLRFDLKKAEEILKEQEVAKKQTEPKEPHQKSREKNQNAGQKNDQEREPEEYSL